jgi:hypothetical protein
MPVKDKILFWIDGDLFSFGIAKYIQDNYDCELYSVIEISGKAKEYFQNQNTVKFEKSWFYDESKIKNPKANLEYLKEFERKYNVNLWEIAYTERYFYKKWNKYYKFEINEILYLMEKICRLCEEIVEVVKPKFLVIKMPGMYHQNLIYRMCRANGINVLMTIPDRFGYRSLILNGVAKFDKMEISEKNNIKRTFSELKEYVKKYDVSKQQKEGIEKFEILKITQMLRWFKKFFLAKEPFTNNIYSYGQNRWKVLLQGISLSIRKINRERFMKKNFIKHIDKKTKFVYFPLHYEPELVLLTDTPFYTDQIQVISNIAKSLPIDYKLYVKEHPAMKLVGWRKDSIYKEILNLLNVELVHQSIPSSEMIEKCSMVACVAGTTGLEAAFQGKCSMIFSAVIYDILSCVHKVDNVEDIPKIIRKCLNDKVNVDDLNNYINLAEENSFECDIFDIYSTVNKLFYEDGVSSNMNISDKNMEYFLNGKKMILEKIAKEHIKKIKTTNS